MKHLILIIAILFLPFTTVHAQKHTRERIPSIGSLAPSFKAPTTNGPISFPADFGKKWKILFAHPKDFTPVCSSEILELAYHQKEFKELNTQIVVISVDRMASHLTWKADLEKVNLKNRGTVKIEFPLVVDSTATISNKYGMVDPQSTNTQNIRGVFFIDPENKVKAFLFYPIEVGRNIDEIIRLLQALQAQYANQNTVLPCNWQPGDDAMIPFLSKEDKEELQSPESNIHFINWYMIYRNINE
ncbi:MAG: peroxiredoxin [Prolixibacteraceae bacterium]